MADLFFIFPAVDGERLRDFVTGAYVGTDLSVGLMEPLTCRDSLGLTAQTQLDLFIAAQETERLSESVANTAVDLSVVVAQESRRISDVVFGASLSAAAISAGLSEVFKLAETATVITGGQARLAVGDVTTQFRKWIDANAAGVDANTKIEVALQAALISANTDLTTLVREFIAR